ncbi:transketolase [Arsenicibacter rosenii]|uniref:Transketolase n=1 Tax=Arsenicibacter rosenii TaxID=1750698 RepID=A0A1S2VJH0_9BACT|nr:transketolase [Arsenicibacter rosenii]OIN58356.1 transketolase [Arsenicibacter rosenii]
MVTEAIDTKTLCGQLRLKVLDLYNQAHAGHIGCSLSCIDIIAASLILRKREQDTFILSKGHAAAALYASLHHLGELTDADLASYYLNGTTLPAHPAPNKHKGIPFATGSLGHGLPIGTGIAKANKLTGENGRVFVLMSDGETNEGTTWEAAHFAMQNQLDNLIILIDKNGLQGFGYTQDVLGDTADPAKWKAIGFDVVEADGHDVQSLTSAIDEVSGRPNGVPKVVVAHTIKGKGVSYMEDRLEWHYLPMTPDQYAQAVDDVTSRYF